MEDLRVQHNIPSGSHMIFPRLWPESKLSRLKDVHEDHTMHSNFKNIEELNKGVPIHMSSSSPAELNRGVQLVGVWPIAVPSRVVHGLCPTAQKPNLVILNLQWHKSLTKKGGCSRRTARYSHRCKGISNQLYRPEEWNGHSTITTYTFEFGIWRHAQSHQSVSENGGSASIYVETYISP